MHYLNDVQDLWGGGGQTNVCGVFGDGMQGRSFLMPKYEFSLFLGTFQSKC